MFRTTLAAASLGLVLATPAFAQQMTAEMFVTQAASGGMYEVQSSEQVLETADLPTDVAAFAQQMVADHTQANEQLTALAEEQGLQVPSELQPEHQQMLDELEAAESPAETYGQQQLMAHQQTVDLFQQYAEGGDNEQLKQLAEQTLPILQEHLEMAQSLPGAQ